MRRLLILLLFTQPFLYANPSNIHAFLAKKDTFNLSFGFEKMNDALDIFNIKEREVDTDSKNYTSLGDMEGINLNMGYTFSEKWYLNINLNQKKLNYLGSKLNSKRVDIYIRQQLYLSNHWAFAMDLGYVTNRADDASMDSVEAINNTLEDILPNKEIELKEIDEKQVLFYRGDDKSVKTVELENPAYIKVKDTSDNGFYLRAIASLRQKNWLFDAYLGYSEVEIENKIESSIFDEPNPDLQKELENIRLVQKRKDIIYFGGMGVKYNFNNKWQSDFNYKYMHIFRISCLDNSNNNHVFNLNLTHKLNSKINFYLGGKVMLSQLNGEIPYIYTKYNKGSFHHKYGFLNGGVSYQF